MTSNYETLYGVGFLDDLHNYFPALLYDSSSFANVRDVLGYIQVQARNRFDLFSYGQREYLSTHPSPAPAPVPPSVSASVPVSRRVVRTSFGGMPAPLTPFNSTLLNQPTTIRTHQTQVLVNESNTSPSTIQQFLGRASETSNVPNLFVDIQQFMNPPQEEDADDEEEEATPAQADRFIANALLSLLNLPQTALTRNYALGPRTMDQFLQPVVVHPTAEQIAQTTSVGNLVSDTDHACAICQDTLTAEQEGRKLNACGHWFHKGCIDTWLERDVHCPVCRHDIREPLARTEA
jgi:hypothetical protein